MGAVAAAAQVAETAAVRGGVAVRARVEAATAGVVWVSAIHAVVVKVGVTAVG